MSNEETILKKLADIETLLRDNVKKILTFDEFCQYAGISKSHGYKLTSTNQIPFYRPHGKMIYLERTEVDSWLMQNRIRSQDEITKEVAAQ